MIETFPGGAVKRYFAPFIDNVNLIGKFEGLRAELLRLLKEAGENVPELPEGRIINRSADDIVSACAKAPRAILERFLANEAEYCSRFGYDRLPEECLDDNPECQRKWFPILPSRGGAAAENSKPARKARSYFRMALYGGVGQSRGDGNWPFGTHWCGAAGHKRVAFWSWAAGTASLFSWQRSLAMFPAGAYTCTAGTPPAQLPHAWAVRRNS
ncbi:MAG TPA: hypothetical protein VMR62_23415 [Bryobacteraceae bacterium]|nr:hypothetical protein [Bryobacteraceae bacterium]